MSIEKTEEMIPRAHISTENSVQLLHDLVAIPSPSGEENEAVKHLVGWMRANGYDQAFIDDAGNAVGIMGSGRREIVLLGHIDTFGGMPDVRIENSTLWGRGSVDAKGSLCTFTVATACATLPPDTRVVVIGAVEEETSSSKGARFAMNTYQPDYCIIGEPSHWDRITLGYKGRLLLDWHWHGALAHSASDVLSPAEHAVHDWQRIQNYVHSYNENVISIFHRLDATLQDIHSEQDGAFGWSQMTCGFRLPPAITPETLAEELAHCLESDAKVIFRGHETAYTAEKDSHLTRIMRRAIRNADAHPRFVHKTGTSDMNVVASSWQCPMIAYGPGDSSLDHTPDEHIDLTEYQQAIGVLADALSQI